LVVEDTQRAQRQSLEVAQYCRGIEAGILAIGKPWQLQWGGKSVSALLDQRRGLQDRLG